MCGCDKCFSLSFTHMQHICALIYFLLNLSALTWNNWSNWWCVRVCATTLVYFEMSCKWVVLTFPFYSVPHFLFCFPAKKRKKKTKEKKRKRRKLERQSFALHSWIWVLFNVSYLFLSLICYDFVILLPLFYINEMIKEMFNICVCHCCCHCCCCCRFLKSFTHLREK